MKNLILFFSVISFVSCASKENANDNGTPVSGAFIIWSDPSFLPLIRVLTEGYMTVYPQVVITIDSSATRNIYSKLAENKIRSAATSVILNREDSIALRQRNIVPQIFHFATDALILISKSNKDSSTYFSFANDDKICLENTITPAALKIISDHSGSENNRYLYTILNENDSCNKHRFNAGSQNAVMKRISEYEGEVGMIGWSYLCEKHNPDVKTWRKMLTTLPYKSAESKLIFPSQSTLMTGEYPLSRKLFIVTSEPYAGPATGFASYVASDEGQRIVRLFGIAPAKTPPREIIVN